MNYYIKWFHICTCLKNFINNSDQFEKYDVIEVNTLLCDNSLLWAEKIDIIYI